jgi:gas vesicle protein
MRKGSSINLLWLLAGFGLGTAVGLVLAPKPGAQTRREYYDRGRELYERGRHLADEAADLFDEGRKLIEVADAQAEATGA